VASPLPRLCAEDTAAGGRTRSRCAQGLEPPLLARVRLLLLSSTAGYAPPVRGLSPSPRRGTAPSLAARARSQLLEPRCEASGLGLTAQRCGMRPEAAPMAWIRVSFYNWWVWDAGDRGSVGRLWGRRALLSPPVGIADKVFMLDLAVGMRFPREQRQLPLRVSDCPLSATSPVLNVQQLSPGLTDASGRCGRRSRLTAGATETEAGQGYGWQAQSTALGGRTWQGSGKRRRDCGAGVGVTEASGAGADRG